jgi:hypothetical protein
MPITTIGILPSPDYSVNSLASQVSLEVVPARLSMTVLASTVDLNSYSYAKIRISRTGPVDYAMKIELDRSGEAIYGAEYNYEEPIVIPKGESFVDVVISPANDWEPVAQTNLLTNDDIALTAQTNLATPEAQELFSSTHLFVPLLIN